MFHIKTSSSSRNFVQENSTAPISKQGIHENFTPGTFTTHHPSQCYHLLNARSIHLKQEHLTDRKKFVRIFTQHYVRDLLIPDAANDYPAIWHVNDIERIKMRSLRLTKDEKQANIQQKIVWDEQLKEECERRKILISEWDRVNTTNRIKLIS